MKLPMALKQYFEQQPNGRPTPLMGELAPFVKSMTKEEKEAAKAELRSYWFDIEDEK